MASVHNIVAETTTTSGSGLTISLTALGGYARFSRFAVGTTVHYVIDDGANKEIGIGTVQAGNTLDRTTVEETLVAGVLTTAAPGRITLSGGSALVRCDVTRSYLDAVAAGIADVAADLAALDAYTNAALLDVYVDLAPKANPAFTGIAQFEALRENYVAVAASAIDLSLGSVFSKTISGATTFTVSNVAASGDVSSFVLELTNGGSATVTWFSGVKWEDGTAPTLTASGTDILGFYTRDGGTTWRGFRLARDSK